MRGKGIYVAILLLAAITLTACKADAGQEQNAGGNSNFIQDNTAQDSRNDAAGAVSPAPSQGVTADDKENYEDSTSGQVQDDAGGAGASVAGPAETPAEEPAADPLTEAIFEGKDAAYRKMIEKSLISTGNISRMKKAIEKAKNGEEVVIAYIGGSITEGASASSKEKNYAYLSYKYFKETFGKDGGDNVKYVNAGMGGTPSALGVIRYDRDVTSYGELLPDIVYIEFSVNDYQEPTRGAAFESMVRKIMNAPNQPAVVLLFCVFQSRWNMQDTYIPIGYYYELPMISIKNALVPELEAGRITDSQFFADIYHPTDFGHSLMADCLKYYYATVNAQEETDELNQVPAAARLGKAFEEIKMYDRATADDNVIVEEGGFSGTDSALVRFATGQPSFPNNWKHTSSSGNEPFRMTLNCKNLLLVYKSSGGFGTALVYLDGELAMTLNATEGGGWNNPVTVLLINNTEAAEHEIEIKMADGHENKEFTIMAIGYTR